ncbi:DUF6497 family protein [Gemmobacter sp.]|uniref:DUF6497 family protein n=1 Tax=Gemmobacter sp. TaxID=1898957 RepID=UPI002AFDF405|nr:DUF6497 family protein [Gemmobacter sp.]
MRGAWLAGLLIASPAFGQELVEVPSGQPVTLQDVILNEPGPAGLTARFRFVAPQIARIGGSIDFDTAAADMDHLCATYALPRIETTTGPRPAQVVISFADRPVEFGVITPEATQFFEAYSIADGTCVWEAF